jgi:hypothetical protein
MAMGRHPWLLLSKIFDGMTVVPLAISPYYCGSILSLPTVNRKSWPDFADTTRRMPYVYPHSLNLKKIIS